MEALLLRSLATESRPRKMGKGKALTPGEKIREKKIAETTTVVNGKKKKKNIFANDRNYYLL